MQLTMSILAVITAGQGACVLVRSVEKIADEIADNEQPMARAMLDTLGHVRAASLAAVQFMAGACLLILQWV